MADKAETMRRTLGDKLREYADTADREKLAGIGLIIIGDYVVEHSIAKSDDAERDAGLMAQSLHQFTSLMKPG